MRNVTHNSCNTGIVIGIDVGISTTKIVGVDVQGAVLNPFRIRATDPITSLYGAFGKYLHDNGIQLNDVAQVMLTGVGAAYIDEDPQPKHRSLSLMGWEHVMKVDWKR